MVEIGTLGLGSRQAVDHVSGNAKVPVDCAISEDELEGASHEYVIAASTDDSSLTV